MKKRLLLIVPTFIVVGAFISWLWITPSGISQAPDISLTITDGSEINLQQYRGRPVLVTFWATSCVGCVREMPHLVELYNELSPKGFEIIGIAMPYDPPHHVVKMISDKSIPYKIAFDIQGKAMLAFGDILVTPTSFLIAPDGTIAKHQIGELDMHELRNTILSMLPAEEKLTSHQTSQSPTS